MVAAWAQDTGVAEVWDVVMAGAMVAEGAAGGNKKYFRTYPCARDSCLKNKGMQFVWMFPFFLCMSIDM
jgi:hypothetical protein